MHRADICAALEPQRKALKVCFTAWRDQPPPRRSLVSKGQLDAWSKRLSVLFGAATRLSNRQAVADSEALQKEIAAITAEVQTIDADRTALLSVEDAAADAATRKAHKHKKVGTLGYQVWDNVRAHLMVDEAGKDLPAQAVFSYEVIDDDPPLPAWAKDGRIVR